MRASLRIAVLSLAVAGLGACATTKESTSYVPPQKAPSIMDNDDAYVAAVEREARRRGIYVQWVNMPRKSPAQVEQELKQQQQ